MCHLVCRLPVQMTNEQAQDYCKRKGTFVQKQQMGVQKVSRRSMLGQGGLSARLPWLCWRSSMLAMPRPKHNDCLHTALLEPFRSLLQCNALSSDVLLLLLVAVRRLHRSVGSSSCR